MNSRRNFLKTAGLGAAALSLAPALNCAQKSKAIGKKYNVLFIAVDDLRPQLSCYGQKQILSPNIDRLAAEGTLFERCFCQVPVCGASRASLLSGVRPNRDRFVNYYTWAEKDAPDATVLPKYFKKNGYYTISNGKVFHNYPDSKDSWSEPVYRPDKIPEDNWRDYVLDENIIAELQKGRGPAFEIADVHDTGYCDGKTAIKAIDDLRRLKKLDKPFFLATGFLKPHLPFNPPKKYWDMYNLEDINLADNPFKPKDAPDASMHNWGELRAYAGIPKEGSLPDELARTLIHGYYASVTYIDAQIGRLLYELDRLKLRDNTIVVLWGDHGWQLGEHSLWCKHCNYETSLHAPMIISAPGGKGGQRTRALTEFVDIYPTLCELCGLPLPEHLQGTSFVPLLQNPARNWKKATFSRFHDGESVRTDRYLYTEYKNDLGSVYARMLYDHQNDPKENVNISERPKNKELVARLSKMLNDGWKPVRDDLNV